MHHQPSSSQNDDTAPHLPTYGANEHHSTHHLESTATTSQVSENNALLTASNPSEGIFTSENYLISTPQDRTDITTDPHIRANSALNGSAPTSPTNLQDTPLPLVPTKGLSSWYRNQEPGAQLWLGSGIISLILALCVCIFSVMVLSQPAGTAIIASHPTTTSMPQNTSATTPTQNIISTSTGIQPISQPGQSNPPTYPPTQTGQLTQPPAQPLQPVPPPDKPINSQPTPTPFPTPIPTPIPTPAPPTGINGNPWGYDFFPGNYIRQPPAAFCSYFACVQNFFHGRGYVVECTDGTYSLWGGTWVACTLHGNVVTPLYSH